MNRAPRLSRRRALLALWSVAAVAPPRSRIAGAHPSLQPAPAPDRRVPAAVSRIIIGQLEVEERQVKWEARFVEDLSASSLDTVELKLAIEQEYAIEIPDEVVEKLLRVGDLVEYLRKREVLK